MRWDRRATACRGSPRRRFRRDGGAWCRPTRACEQSHGRLSNAVESASSRESASRRSAAGGCRVQNRGPSSRPRECMPFAPSGCRLLSLISRFSRRTTTSSTRPRMAAVISLVRVNRTGSSISSRPVNERVWPLCGVAERKSRCSNCGATRRSIRQSSLSSPKGDGIRLWHSSTISRSQGRCGESSGVRQAERNCSSTSG